MGFWEYYIEFKMDHTGQQGLELISVDPPSDYVEEMFYNETLIRDTNLEHWDCGKFRLDIKLYEDGSFSTTSLEKWIGWVQVEEGT